MAGGESQPVARGLLVRGVGKPHVGRLSSPRTPAALAVLLAVVAALAVQPAPTSARSPGPSASLTVSHRWCYQPQGSRVGLSGGWCASGLVMRVNCCVNGATDLFVATDEQGNLKRYVCKPGNSYLVTRKEVSVQVIPVRMREHLIVAKGRAITFASARPIGR